VIDGSTSIRCASRFVFAIGKRRSGKNRLGLNTSCGGPGIATCSEIERVNPSSSMQAPMTTSESLLTRLG
jgi:hypothetical protein